MLVIHLRDCPANGKLFQLVLLWVCLDPLIQRPVGNDLADLPPDGLLYQAEAKTFALFLFQLDFAQDLPGVPLFLECGCCGIFLGCEHFLAVNRTNALAQGVGLPIGRFGENLQVDHGCVCLIHQHLADLPRAGVAAHLNDPHSIFELDVALRVRLEPLRQKAVFIDVPDLAIHPLRPDAKPYLALGFVERDVHHRFHRLGHLRELLNPRLLGRGVFEVDVEVRVPLFV
mmetsp:Transcript_39831/g.112820  ORF Transcript_39831/g.112820 Transcript_39831/m.112820 type:complete len:229 (-) Transcript_39831:520-1206(-)